MPAESAGVVLVAPLEGWCAPLDELPDPVFAGRMLGDGVAIDPTGSTLHAPCDGEVIALPGSRHAVTVRAANGAEVLMHVGLDTVGLKGDGFEALAQVGDRVSAGTPLLRFDLDRLAECATSLLTPVIVVNPGYSITGIACGGPVRVGDRLLVIATSVAGNMATTGGTTPAIAGGTAQLVAGGTAERVAGGTAQGAASSADVITRRAVVRLAHGLHARPAARIADAVRTSGSTLRLTRDGRNADGRSVTALMMLGVRHGDELTITAQGPAAAGAVDAVAAVLAGQGDATMTSPATAKASSTAKPDSAPAMTRAGATLAGAVRVATTAGTAPVATTAGGTFAGGMPAAKSADEALTGVVASRGLAVGVTHHLRTASFEVPETGAGLAHEAAALDRALNIVRATLLAAATATDPARREIAAAHVVLLDDPVLVTAAEHVIERGGSAGHAWRTAVREQAAALECLDDAYLRERAADLRDLEGQVLAALGHRPTGPTEPLPDRAILLSREILPSQFAALDLARVAGICTAGGGPTSHVAIMANAVGLPMVVAAGDGVDSVPDGRLVILDAQAARLVVAPDATQLADVEAAITRERERRTAERVASRRDGRTADGRRIHVYANLGSPADATAAVELGAEGCGLLRTEFLFLERRTAPGEDEQLAIYQQIATTLAGRPLTIRTLDIGGDKPIDYLPLPPEENPALGLRGVRTSLWRPELLREQLRAILRVRPAGQCRILLPMVTDLGDIDAVRAELDAAMAAMGVEETPALGVMIETPAAAVLADSLARHVDFLSVGTNDLTQYTLAMDRGHPELAPRLDGLHPAVLRLVASAASAAHEHGREIAVCGNLAIDAQAVPILIGLGVEELSVAHSAVPSVKARVATLEFEACRALAERALACSTAAQVRALVPR